MIADHFKIAAMLGLRWRRIFSGKSEGRMTKMLDRALELEHAARIQYLAHAEQIQGINAEKCGTS